ncbi:hypothetical protein Q4I30_007848 [Leishmania utingensis]|uniref:Uncharacterized protein n=1 Tax=Leishmania utingensis TaxID=653362 RepID=A0AAW2ZUH9_9TRYP
MRLVAGVSSTLMEQVLSMLHQEDFTDIIFFEDVVDEVLDLYVWMAGPNFSVLYSTLSISRDLHSAEAPWIIERHIVAIPGDGGTALPVSA